MNNKKHYRLKHLKHIKVEHMDFTNNKFNDGKAKDVDVGINNLGLK
ncbi:hypothetical protein [Caloramator quimbayensis]|nr:hypothetical protein [Caloramator quimbayensis]